MQDENPAVSRERLRERDGRNRLCRSNSSFGLGKGCRRSRQKDFLGQRNNLIQEQYKSGDDLSYHAITPRRMSCRMAMTR